MHSPQGRAAAAVRIPPPTDRPPRPGTAGRRCVPPPPPPPSALFAEQRKGAGATKRAELMAALSPPTLTAVHNGRLYADGSCSTCSTLSAGPLKLPPCSRSAPAPRALRSLRSVSALYALSSTFCTLHSTLPSAFCSLPSVLFLCSLPSALLYSLLSYRLA